VSTFFCFRCGRRIENVAPGASVSCPDCHEPLLAPGETTPLPSLKPSFHIGPWLGVLAIITGVVLFYFSPHIAAHQMQRAIERRDAEAVAEFIDFPAVRESFKANLKANMMQQMGDTNRSGFEMLGAAVGAMVADPFIDALMTPENLTLLMRGENAPSQPNAQQHTGPALKRSMRYVSPNSFVVTVQPEDATHDPTALVFRRHGLVSWRLSAIRFDLLMRANSAPVAIRNEGQ
jgi:hypothetical protein